MSLSVKFDDRAEASISFMRVALELESDVAVITRALALLKVATEAKLRGDTLVIVSSDETTEKEIVF